MTVNIKYKIFDIRVAIPTPVKANFLINTIFKTSPMRADTTFNVVRIYVFLKDDTGMLCNQ